MPQIDFYFLQTTDVAPSYHYICRVIEKAYQRRHHIYVNARHLQEAHALDEMLWTFKDTSFIPHNIIGEGPDQPPPVQLGFNQDPKQHRDILINLNHDIPSYHQKFKRVLEIIANIDESKQAAEKHIQFYQQQKYLVNQHHIKA